jgi:arsenical pump membrane protein
VIVASHSSLLIWGIAALAVLGVIARPWRLPEAIWAAMGAVLLVVSGLIPWRAALGAVGKGTDVYLFLVGMMLLAELARREGLFDTVAALAVGWARGSATRLFALVYAVGVVVTVFLSNDATAVVLTPAVYAAARAAKAEPLPYLFICAFVANAASFVLPISNPANLVLFGSHMPPLTVWLARFALPSLLAIGATYFALRLTQGAGLKQDLARDIPVPSLRRGGWLALAGIVTTALVLLTASAYGADLGLPTFVAGGLTALVVLVYRRQGAVQLLHGISWSVLPLVAGLFVLVEGLNLTGVTGALAAGLAHWAAQSQPSAGFGSGIAVALVCNLVNNLPAGLIAGAAAGQAALPDTVTGALLVGVDLGPNLSVTGSLATILWLLALRREGESVGFWRFLKVGAVVMPPALLLALGALFAAVS